jgi:glycosyltransferase involved in cell wall biosynthesis
MSKKAESESCNHHLAIFVPTLQYGGVERVMLNLATGFADRGFKVDLVAADARGQLRPQVPAEVRTVDLVSSRVLASLPALVRYLRQQRPAALIAAMSHSSVVALWARRLAGVQTRIIATEHTNLSPAFNNFSRWRVRLLPFFMRRYFPWADGIVAVSNGVAEDVASWARLPQRRITVIYNPVLTKELLEKAREPVQHPWLVPNQPPVVLAVGRLSIEKDFSTLVRAFAQVRQQRPARLLILGEGDERPRLETLSRDLGVVQDICLTGYQENPYAYMARAQVFVSSSIYEGFGLALVEAMATGVSVVSTDCESGPREILQHGRYGTLVPVGSVEALAKAILSKLDQGRQSVPSDWLRNFEVSTAVNAYWELISGESKPIMRIAPHLLDTELSPGNTAVFLSH